MRLWYFFAANAAACLLNATWAHGLELELAAQSVATLNVDDQTRGGGLGLSAEVGVPVLPLGPRGVLIVRASLGALMGNGLAWSVEGGAAYRHVAFESWQPDAGLSVLWLGGDLVRTIDEQGQLAGDPLALRLGVSPLRFTLEAGWISVLSLRAGPTLFRSGQPPLSVSLMLFEVGTNL
jgi:hypothetical protein